MRSRHAQRRQTGDKLRAKSVTNQHENHHHINHHHYHRHHLHYHRHDDHMVIPLLKAQSKKVAPTNTACMQQTIDTKMHLMPMIQMHLMPFQLLHQMVWREGQI